MERLELNTEMAVLSAFSFNGFLLWKRNKVKGNIHHSEPTSSRIPTFPCLFVLFYLYLTRQIIKNKFFFTVMAWQKAQASWGEGNRDSEKAWVNGLWTHNNHHPCPNQQIHLRFNLNYFIEMTKRQLSVIYCKSKFKYQRCLCNNNCYHQERSHFLMWIFCSIQHLSEPLKTVWREMLATEGIVCISWTIHRRSSKQASS